MAAEHEFRVWLESEGENLFKEALKLGRDDSKNDPETEPYKSKYAARELLLNLQNKIDSFNVDEFHDLKFKFFRSVVEFELGVNHIETEELSTGERYLSQIKEKVEEFKLKPEFCSVMIKCFQQLGMLWTTRGDNEKSLGYFTEAERLYNEYKTVSEIAPFDTDFEDSSNNETKFESLHTHTLFYITQAYKNNGQNNKSAEYGHKTLQRQLSTKNYDPVDWAVSCAALSQYHLTQGDYRSARHCLACASCVISECEVDKQQEPNSADVKREPDSVDIKREPDSTGKEGEPNSTDIKREPDSVDKEREPDSTEVKREPDSTGKEGEPNSTDIKREPDSVDKEREPDSTEVKREPDSVDIEGEDDRKHRERIPEARANVACCWSKYCLNLLKLSATSEDDTSKDPPKEKDTLQFEGLDVSKIESEISFEIANNFEEARVLFLAGQKHLNTAKEFYQLDGHAVSYVEIVQDHSQLFKYLARFELDLERRCKMCKRRVDMLTEALVQLNPQYYLLICRQLTYEIGSIYGDMADFKMEIIKISKQDQPSLRQIKKINSLFENCAKFFTHFIDSLKHEEKLPEKFDQSVLRVALLAHMYLAHAHAKQICATREEKVANHEKALELYTFVVDYCEKDELGAWAFHDELEACREMVQLLPLRLEQIRQE